MMTQKLLAWFRQPTTVGGLSGLAGVLAAIAMDQITWQRAIPFLAGSVVSILLPDNAGNARVSAEKLAQQVAGEISHT